MPSRILVVAGLVAGAISLVGAQSRQPVTHEAVWLMPRVGAPVVSPDGKWVVVAVTQPAYDDKDQTSDLWLAPADGTAAPRRLTSTKASESGVTWSADSRRIAFSTKREGDEANQIYTLDLAGGGEATRVTSISTGATSPAWRPDGRAILFVSLVYPNAPDDAANKKAAAERKDQKYKVRAYDSFPVRYWDRWLDDRQVHIFVQSLESDSTPKDLLAGTKLAQNPGFSGRRLDAGEELDAVWAPDGASIVFAATTNRTSAAFEAVHTQLYHVAAGGGEPRALTHDKISYEHPKFRPDGRAIYFTSNADEKQIYALDRLAMAPWPPESTFGEPVILSKGFDRSVESWAFSADSQTIYLTAEDAGLEKIYAVPARGGETTLAVAPPRGVYTNLTIASRAAEPVVIADWSSSVNPAEVVRIDVGGRRHRALTAFAAAQAAALDWQPPEHFWFTNSRGRQIHSLIVRPPNFDAARKYPLLLSIHGGAASMSRDQITLRWNYHLLAKPGYVVLLTNYTGSTGFGEAFARAIQFDPLAGPANDLNEAADEAIRRFPFIDATRQAAAGASYGGHLANWLEATTTRYKAIISHAGEANIEAQWGTSDGIYHRELMMGGPPWEQAPAWRDQNPIRRAANFKTPILLSVGENDFRVPINNTLENWSALQRMKVPGRLLVWPNANHQISNGEDSRHFYVEVHAWLAHWLGPENPASSTRSTGN
jgi:dipeptidyl aminopeptidase/acylaminoacyl peptidase